MFLDEKLYKIASDIDVNSKESVVATIQKMINACTDSIEEQIGNDKSDSNILANFKRVDIVWRQVCEKLDKEGKGFVRSDGFKFIIQSKHPNVFYKN